MAKINKEEKQKIINDTIERVLNVLQFKSSKKGWCIPSSKQLRKYIDYWFDDSSQEILKKYLEEHGYN